MNCNVAVKTLNHQASQPFSHKFSRIIGRLSSAKRAVIGFLITWHSDFASLANRNVVQRRSEQLWPMLDKHKLHNNTSRKKNTAVLLGLEYPPQYILRLHVLTLSPHITESTSESANWNIKVDPLQYMEKVEVS